MPFIPATNVIEVRMQFLYFEQECENVYHFKSNAANDSTKLTTIADTFKNWWTTDMKTACSTSLSLQRVLVRDLTTSTGIVAESSSGLPVSGTVTDPGMPGNVTLAIKWGTGLAGRTNRGRTFHLGLSEGQVVGNAVDSSTLNGIVGKYDALRTALDNVVLDGEFCVLSKYLSGAPRAAGVCTPISGVRGDAAIDSMRRRLRGRGR